MRIAILLAAGTVALTSGAASAMDQRLIGGELEAAMIGAPLTLVSPHRGDIGSVTWNPDGTGAGELRSPSGRTFKFTGKWEFRKDQFCRTLETQGRESCFAIFRTADGTLEQRDYYGRVSLRLKPAVVIVEKPAPAPRIAPPPAPPPAPAAPPPVEEEEEEVPQK